MASRQQMFWGMSAILLAFCIGCGSNASGPKTIEVKGNVTHNGTPIKLGDIAFYPDGGTGAPTAGPIADGKYHLSDRSAIVAGVYRVEIRAYKQPEKAVKDSAGIERPSGNVTPEQILPAKFNAQTTIEKLTVKETDEVITKDFDLVD